MNTPQTAPPDDRAGATVVEIPPSVLGQLRGKLGFSDAVDRVGTTAAPLLAGFGLTLVGLTVGTDTNARWPALALGLLVAAVLLLVGAVQASFNGRSWYIPLSEFLTRLQATPADQRSTVTGTYTQGLIKCRFWLGLTQWLYNLGVLFLLAGLVFTVVPTGPIETGRAIVIVVAAIGFLVEAAWFLYAAFRAAR